jgi:hypothetical protein
MAGGQIFESSPKTNKGIELWKLLEKKLRVPGSILEL